MTDDFFGKVVHGNITHYGEREGEQHDPIELVNLLDALMSFEHVQSVRWNQYTPYFNDGEPCVFTTGELYIKLDVTDDEEGDYEDGYISTYYLYDYKPGRSYRDDDRVFTYKNIDTKDIYDALEALENALPHHKVILQHKFGDPAEVVYDGESFDVEFYDHD